MDLLTLAVAPVILLAIFVYNKDKCEKEPPSMLVKAFLGGVGAVVLTVLTAGFFDMDASPDDGVIWYLFSEAFLEAAIPEELFKFLFFMIIVWKSKYFDEHFDGIVYATFVSLGFACIENIVYVFRDGAGVGIMRAILSVPGHFLFGVLMGYYLSLAKFGIPSDRNKNIVLALAISTLTHGIYDSLCFSFNLFDSDEGDTTIFVIVVFVVFIVFNVKLWKQCLKRIKEQATKDENGKPVLPQQQ